MRPEISIVLPARDEAGNLPDLLEGIARVMAETEHEIIVVDDASRDGTRDILRAAMGRMPQLQVICHTRACGQSAAIRSGILAARGRIIATLDGDGQNPPENLPRLLAPLLTGSGIGLVQGERVDRKDSASKRWASRIANRIRQAVLQDGVRDSGCGLKAFPREVYLALPFFDHIHRFMPALVQREGWRVETVPVSHAERKHGRSKYGNVGRALIGCIDLLGTAWLIRRRRLPQTTLLSRPATQEAPAIAAEDKAESKPAA